MKSNILPAESESQWNSVLFEMSQPHFLQSWAWGEHKSDHGWQVYRMIVMQEEKKIGAFQLLTRVISSKPKLKLGYCPRGPIFSSGNAQLVITALAEYAKELGCFVVKADPDIETGTTIATEWYEACNIEGWKYSSDQIQPRATGVTDLLQGDPNGEEKLLSGMKKQWRYNVKLGPKRGVKVFPVTDNYFDEFYDVFNETGKRQGFTIRNLEYYQEVANRFSSGNKSQSQLFIATHPDEKSPLAGAFLLSFGDRWWYFYGASSNRRRADMPTYALQWLTQRWARDHGGKTYDWWGAPEDPDNKSDKRYSVWHFKKGFGPRHVLTVGAFDKPLNNKLYKLYIMSSAIRRKFAKIKASISI